MIPSQVIENELGLNIDSIEIIRSPQDFSMFRVIATKGSNQVIIPVSADHILDLDYLLWLAKEIKRQLGIDSSNTVSELKPLLEEYDRRNRNA